MKMALQRNIKDLYTERQAVAEQEAQLKLPASCYCFPNSLSHRLPTISKIIIIFNTNPIHALFTSVLIFVFCTDYISTLSSTACLHSLL